MMIFFPLLIRFYDSWGSLAAPPPLPSIYLKEMYMNNKKKIIKKRHVSELLRVSLHSAGSRPPAMHQSETSDMGRDTTQTANKSRRAQSTWAMSATEGHLHGAGGSDGSGDEIIN